MADDEEPARYPFAGPQWLAALHGTNVLMADEFAAWLDGREYSMCEVYTGVPADLAPAGRVAWTLRVKGDDVRFTLDEAEPGEVGLKVVADWEVFRSCVRLPMADVARMEEIIAQGVADGTVSVTGDMTDTPPFVARNHDAMARITR